MFEGVINNTDPMQILDKEIFKVAEIRFSRKGKVKESESATGFFYKYDDQFYFITNKHVVIDEEENHCPDELRLRLHVNKNNLSQNRVYNVSLYDEEREKLWLEHPTEEWQVDVVAVPVEVDDWTPKPHIEPFSEDDDISKHPRDIPIGEDLIVIGYPQGVHDSIHNTPIIRSAILATMYPLHFCDSPGVLIDSRLHEGSSGSPVLTKPGAFYRTTSGKVVPNLDRRRTYKRYLVGIHSHTYPIDLNGDRDDGDIRTLDQRVSKLEDKIYQDNFIGLNFVWFSWLIPEIINQHAIAPKRTIVSRE